jgi:hypothetical protein
VKQSSCSASIAGRQQFDRRPGLHHFSTKVRSETAFIDGASHE